MLLNHSSHLNFHLAYRSIKFYIELCLSIYLCCETHLFCRCPFGKLMLVAFSDCSSVHSALGTTTGTPLRMLLSGLQNMYSIPFFAQLEIKEFQRWQLQDKLPSPKILVRHLQNQVLPIQLHKGQSSSVVHTGKSQS